MGPNSFHVKVKVTKLKSRERDECKWRKTDLFGVSWARPMSCSGYLSADDGTPGLLEDDIFQPEGSTRDGPRQLKRYTHQKLAEVHVKLRQNILNIPSVPRFYIVFVFGTSRFDIK